MRSFLIVAMLLLTGAMGGIVLESRTFGPMRRAAAPLAAAELSKANMEVAEPGIVVDVPTFDFGQVEQGSVVEYVFVLRNTGSKPVVVDKVRPACGCTVAKLSSKTINPGQTAQLATTLDLKGREGKQNKTIAITTSAPVASTLKLAMVGTVSSMISKEPSSLTFARVLESPVSSSLDIRLKDDLSFKVTDVQTSHDGIVAKVEEVSEGHLRLSVDLQPTLPQGPLSGWVHLITDHGGSYQKIPIAVTATVGDGGPIAVGDMPVAAGPTIDGGQADLASFKGHPTVLVFWASWCGHCKKEMPNLLDMYRKYHDSGLEILGVNTDKETALAQAACKEWDFPWPNIHFQNNGEAGFKNPLMSKYQIRGVPAVYLVDREGKVKTTSLRGPALEKVVEKMLDL